MKRYMGMLAVVFLVSYGLYVSGQYYTNAPRQGTYVYPYGNVPYQEPVVYRDTEVYPITIMTSGEDAIVNAIKHHSNLTQADENRWGFSWVPVVGSSIRGGMITKVRDFMRVCRGSVLAKGYFESQQVLMSWFSGHDPVEVCRALDNLSQQGGYALALLGRFGTSGDRGLYGEELGRFIRNIKINKELMGYQCNMIKQEQGFQSQQKLRVAQNELEYNKTWWKTMALRWKMTKEMGTTALNGAKWLMEKANENGVPLLSAAAVWLVYDKLFGKR